jgi:hypothetical protein
MDETAPPASRVQQDGLKRDREDPEKLIDSKYQQIAAIVAAPHLAPLRCP